MQGTLSPLAIQKFLVLIWWGLPAGQRLESCLVGEVSTHFQKISCPSSRRLGAVRWGHKSDTPGRAGGLMRGTASKAVGSCAGATIARRRRHPLGLGCLRGFVPAQHQLSRPHSPAPNNVRPRRGDLVPPIAERWRWHACLCALRSPRLRPTWAVAQDSDAHGPASGAPQ